MHYDLQAVQTPSYSMYERSCLEKINIPVSNKNIMELRDSDEWLKILKSINLHIHLIVTEF